jgi:UDP-sugar transporter A1/2/3
VAVVVKYADNVLKGFATSISILISALVSWHMFHDLDVNLGFLIGAVVVLVAVYYYEYAPPPVRVVNRDSDEEKQLLSA